jgi:hypothetical protein
VNSSDDTFMQLSDEDAQGNVLTEELASIRMSDSHQNPNKEDSKPAMMNSFYVANDTVVISIALFSPERPGKEEGWNFQNRRFGLGRLVRSPF